MDRKLVRAHIVPEAFFRVLRTGGETPLLVTNTPGYHPKRSPIGVYDQGILCDSCEPKFSKVDTYGTEVLLKRFDDLFQPVRHKGAMLAFQAQNIDQELLLRFLVATVWRGSVSNHPFFHSVRLGPYEPSAAASISHPESPLSCSFAAILSRWTATEQRDFLTHGLMSPFREHWMGVNAYRFYFGRIVAYIKVSNQKFPKPLVDLALTSQQTLSVVAREFDDSKDFSAMIRVAKESSGGKK